MIRIVTDSTSDLPPDLVSGLGITVVPAYINIGDRSFKDGQELTRDEFYAQLPSYPTPPTTAAPAVGSFTGAYERLAEEGATDIVSIHVAGSLSGMLNAARLGAEAARGVRIHLVDSGQLSMGLGWQVVRAAQAAASGMGLADVKQLLHEARAKTHVFAVLDTLEFLRRSGRVSWAQFGLGSLLSIKPIISFYEGQVGMERVRTEKRALSRLLDIFKSLMPVAELAILHTGAPEAAASLCDLLGACSDAGNPPPVVGVTPAIGAHIGPGAVGFACIQSP